MKILCINGSPKREKSDTMRITRAFLDGLRDTVPEVAVEILHAVDCRIEYCHGCFTCMRNGGHCAIEDDMRGILQKMLDSDVLLFSFPLYCYGMPAPLKALIDRVLPLSSMEMEKIGDRYAHTGQADYAHCATSCSAGVDSRTARTILNQSSASSAFSFRRTARSLQSRNPRCFLLRKRTA